MGNDSIEISVTLITDSDPPINDNELKSTENKSLNDFKAKFEPI
jgi:hypothetical protein